MGRHFPIIGEATAGATATAIATVGYTNAVQRIMQESDGWQDVRYMGYEDGCITYYYTNHYTGERATLYFPDSDAPEVYERYTHTDVIGYHIE